jgi:hypothetical protein
MKWRTTCVILLAVPALVWWMPTAAWAQCENDGRLSCEYLVDAPQCYGDVNGDGVVNPQDVGLVKFYYNYGTNPDNPITFEELCRYDVNRDDQITPQDVGLVKFWYGSCDDAPPPAYIEDPPNDLWKIDGGQISMAGATLFVDFFIAPASTNDWVDVDEDGIWGFDEFRIPPVDQLANIWQEGVFLDTWWMFQYRSIGSVNGFNEFVANQLCGVIPDTVPSEVGLLNHATWAEDGNITLAGDPANLSGTPFEPCEIEGAFLDVPGAWAVKVDGTPIWSAKPTGTGYGLNPVVSTTDYSNQLKGLDRDCGVCDLSGEYCTSDDDCPKYCSDHPDRECNENEDCPNHETGETCDLPAGEFCNTARELRELNTDTVSPDENTIYSYTAAWVPIALLSNRGTGMENIRLTEGQYLWTTGRMPNGENLVAACRDVGSGTRNGAMNSVGIDTSWGRGENIGDKASDSYTDPLGEFFQPSNRGGSSRMEGTVQNHRLAVGYTGLGGGSRAAADSESGKYELLNVCKDIDVDGDGTADCDCSAQACPGDFPDSYPAPNDGYVRPTIDTVLDNLDPCCGWQIGGAGSFVVRGNINTNRDPSDPKYEAPTDPGEPLDNQAVADFLINLFDCVDTFTGEVFAGECQHSKLCSISGNPCEVAADCGTNGFECSVSGDPCTIDDNCSYKTCTISGIECTIDDDCLPDGGTCELAETCVAVTCDAQGCDFDAECHLYPLGVCSVSGDPCTTWQDCSYKQCLETGIECDVDEDCTASEFDECQITEVCNQTEYCLTTLNSPCGFLTRNFTVPFGVDATQALDDGTLFTPTPDFNQAAQDLIRAESNIVVSDWGTVTPAGKVPIRTTVTARALYSDGSDGSGYYYWDDASSQWKEATKGTNLSERNAVTADFNGDGVRDADDAAQLVRAYYQPRTWQEMGQCSTDGSFCADATTCGGGTCDRIADGAGLTGNMTYDIAIPEVLADYDGDGNFTKEELRYFADGLATVGGQLDRRQGAINIDTAIAAEGQPYPWADPRDMLVTGNAPVGGVPQNPTYDPPASITGFLATGPAGATYQPGDFRGDVAGVDATTWPPAFPPADWPFDAWPPRLIHNVGSYPDGWDTVVDNKDIDYVCWNIDDWANLDEAVLMDLSCDMDGDLDVDYDDVVELVEQILKTNIGDINFDLSVDGADQAIMQDTIDNDPTGCNAIGHCGWADGDVTCDGYVDANDLAYIP